MKPSPPAGAQVSSTAGRALRRLRLRHLQVLHVGSFSTMALLPLAIAQLRRAVPGAIVRLHEMPPRAMIEGLVAGELDCIVGALPPDVLSDPGVDGLKVEPVMESLSALTTRWLVRFDPGLLGVMRLHQAGKEAALGLLRVLPVVPQVPLPRIALISGRDAALSRGLVAEFGRALRAVRDSPALVATAPSQPRSTTRTAPKARAPRR